MNTGNYQDIDPEDLPVPDRQAMQLIQYSLRDDAQTDILAQLISVNPALTAQLLGLVNSAFFGFRRKIKTVSHAIVAVGMESLRNLVLCFAVKEVVSKNKIPGFDIDVFWEDSIRRAVAARQIAVLLGKSTEEAFTAGMLQDIGLLVLFFMEPEKTDRWQFLRPNLPQARHEMEEALFHTVHDNVGAMLTRKWNLPESYVFAISCHHLYSDPKECEKHEQIKTGSTLAGILHLSDLCNAVYVCHDKAGALNTLKKKAEKFFSLTGDQVDSLLSSLPDMVEEISYALNIAIGAQINFDNIMDKVNRKLVEDNISYQELTWQLQNSLKQRDQYAAKLEAELDIAREIQQSLQPDIGKIHQVAAFNIPALHLSGDFFDYFTIKDGTICFCLGDVSGKGTAAALLMAKSISLFRCLCKVVDNISQIAQLMNNELCETAVRGMFVTFVGGWLKPESNRFDIVNLGHLPPFLVNDEKIIKIEAKDPPLGIVPGILHPARQFSLKNSRLYLYTDGFTEGRLKNTKDPDGTLGLKGFLRWLIQSGKMPLDEQMAWIKAQCRVKLEPQSDDLTLMILSGD